MFNTKPTTQNMFIITVTFTIILTIEIINLFKLIHYKDIDRNHSTKI